jgi:hypothetical protein
MTTLNETPMTDFDEQNLRSGENTAARTPTPPNTEHTLDAGDVPAASGPVPPIDNSASTPAAPYSAFGKRDKWIIVALTSFASFFRCCRPCKFLVALQANVIYSPLTANIYFPAIPTIAGAFG